MLVAFVMAMTRAVKIVLVLQMVMRLRMFAEFVKVMALLALRRTKLLSTTTAEV